MLFALISLVLAYEMVTLIAGGCFRKAAVYCCIILDYMPCMCKHWLPYDMGMCFTAFYVQTLTIPSHYSDVIMGAIASQITSLTIVYSNVYSDADQRKHQSSASLVFVRGPVNSPHKWPVTRKIFPFDDVIMALWHSCFPLRAIHCNCVSYICPDLCV